MVERKTAHPEGASSFESSSGCRILSPKSSGEEDPPGILQVGTFDSSSADDCSMRSSTKSNGGDSAFQDEEEGAERISSATSTQEQKSDHRGEILRLIFYISLFGILGTVLRLFLARLFGLDCEQVNTQEEIGDFLSPLSSQICATSSGKVQRGGVVFTDLPANMIGSFFMGMMSPAAEGRPLPWLRREHPLQNHTPFHIGLKVGFCGCLTTFASWNTQMIMMLDGTDTDFSPQVLTVLFGYLVGVASAIASFLFGRFIFKCPQSRNSSPPADDHSAEATAARSQESAEVSDEDDGFSSERSSDDRVTQWEHSVHLFAVKYGPPILVLGLLVAFGVADGVNGSLFYRKMWMSSLLTPFGAVLRWKLSGYTSSGLRLQCLQWLPLGTFLANIAAAMICAAADAIDAHVIDRENNTYEWVSPALRAIEVGFAGSLSTVSTLVRELFYMDTPGHAGLYCSGTIIFSLLFGWAVYSPIIRSG